MAVTYLTTVQRLFDGPATADVPGDWVRLREAKQLRIWAKASSPVDIRFRYSIFPPVASTLTRDTDFITTSPYPVGTSWQEISAPELDGPLDSLSVVPAGDVADLKVYVAGSAV